MKRAAEWTHPEEERSAKHGSPKYADASERSIQSGLAAEQSPEAPHPASQITCHLEQGHALVHGVDAKRGQRPYMEDAYQISSGSGSGAAGSYTICSVFDGHGGTFVAHHCANNLAQRFSSCFNSSARNAGSVHAAAPETVAQALKSSLSSLHSELKEEREAQLCGTTATACVLTPSHIVIASCGDSRAVIAKAGQAHQPIEDHSLQRADERERILAAGGRLIWNNGLRVMGALGMSRALGDHLLQPHGVSAEPDVALLPRSGDEDFLLLATDGLWGAVSNEEAVEVAYRVLALSRFTRPRAMAAIPCVLTALATRRGSTDNITVLCVDLAPPQTQLPHPAAVAAHQAAQPVPMTATGSQVPTAHPGMRAGRPCTPVVLPPPCVEPTQAPVAAGAAGAAPIPISGRRSASSPLPRGLVAAAEAFVAPTTPSPPRRPSRTVTTGAGPVPTAAAAAPGAAGMASSCGMEVVRSGGSCQVAGAAACGGVSSAATAAGASPFGSRSSDRMGGAAEDSSWPATWGTSSAWPPIPPAASPFAGVASPCGAAGEGGNAPWAANPTGATSRSNSCSSSRQEGSIGGSWLSLARSVSCSAVPAGSKGLQQGVCTVEPTAAASAVVGGRPQTPNPETVRQQQQLLPSMQAAAAVAAASSPAAQPNTCRPAVHGWAAPAGAGVAPVAAQGVVPAATWSAAAAATTLQVYGGEVQRRVSSNGGALSMVAAAGGVQASEPAFKVQARSSGGGSMAPPSMLATAGSGLYKAGSGTFASAAPLAKVSSDGFAVPAVSTGGTPHLSASPSGFGLVSAGSSGNLAAHQMLRPARSLGPAGLLASARSGSATGRTPEVVGVARRCSAEMVAAGVTSGGLSEAERARGVTRPVT